jgi:hypothetical protein
MDLWIWFNGLVMARWFKYLYCKFDADSLKVQCFSWSLKLLMENSIRN